MITGLHHFSIIASSEASVHFYGKLGFEEYRRIKRSYDTVILMDGYGIGLEIYIDPTHPERSTNPENRGLRQLSFRVDSIEKTIKELDLNVGPVMNDWVGERFCIVTDPDGLPVQLHE